ncbi:uncharacterized protein A4U43_C02F18950 [Asparagus officinalis]|uniref:Uncharacterized protein n=1 Tax=Asparagus officinalis TaxID=4686 RepID=A0A5P1FK59_ASPOF|nr:uncharacterized protein A4U43_C02F18950 [Asparagus officinalis]
MCINLVVDFLFFFLVSIFGYRRLKVLSNERMNGTEYTTGVFVVQCPVKEEDLSFLCGIPFPPPDAIQTISVDYSKIEENVVEKKDVSETRREENITEGKDDADMKQKPNLGALKYEDKLEASKRKLREGYNDAEEAKKRRKIMVVDMNDLQPVQSQSKKKTEVKRGCRINKFIKLRPKIDHHSLIW